MRNLITTLVTVALLSSPVVSASSSIGQGYNFMNDANISVVIFALVVLLFIYFIPTLVAIDRKHNNKAAVIIINVFLGWTLLGWVGALVWSVINKESKS